MTAHRDALIAALQGIAKFHLADDPSAKIEMMDTSEELYARWRSAYISRQWFVEQFNAEQRQALAAFGAYFNGLSAKFNKFPPILKFVTSADGKALCERAHNLLALLD